jgi:hypothetical protein
MMRMHPTRTRTRAGITTTVMLAAMGASWCVVMAIFICICIYIYNIHGCVVMAICMYIYNFYMFTYIYVIYVNIFTGVL